MRGVAGQSAERRWEEENVLAGRRRRELGVWLGCAVGVAALALVIWGSIGASGRVLAVGAAAACLVGAWARRPHPDPERWLRGAAGEEATAALLARLPSRRWAVLNDRRIPGSRANIDHLVIGRRGVWVLDSKAYRGTMKVGWRSVRVAGRRLDTGPVAWEASVVADRLGVDVRPLVVVHGGSLPRRGRRCDGVRVLPAGSVLSHLRRARRSLRLDRDAVAWLADRAAIVLPEA